MPPVANRRGVYRFLAGQLIVTQERNDSTYLHRQPIDTRGPWDGSVHWWSLLKELPLMPMCWLVRRHYRTPDDNLGAEVS